MKMTFEIFEMVMKLCKILEVLFYLYIFHKNGNIHIQLMDSLGIVTSHTSKSLIDYVKRKSCFTKKNYMYIRGF